MRSKEKAAEALPLRLIIASFTAGPVITTGRPAGLASLSGLKRYSNSVARVLVDPQGADSVCARQGRRYFVDCRPPSAVLVAAVTGAASCFE